MKLAIVLAVVIVAGCSGSDPGGVASQTAPTSDTTDSSPTTSAASSPATAATTTAAPTTTSSTTTSTTTTTTTTAVESWHRDTELAVRECLQNAQLADSRIEFMYDFDDELVREIQVPCDEAAALLDLEDGPAARSVALTVAEINLALAFEVLNWINGEPQQPPSYDYFLEAFNALARVP